LDRRLGMPQSWCRPCGEDVNLAFARIRTLAVHLVAHCYTNLAILIPVICAVSCTVFGENGKIVKDIKPEGRVIEQNIEAVAFFFLHR
jgi:hypothetical protein